jgi:hypothetical protein
MELWKPQAVVRGLSPGGQFMARKRSFVVRTQRRIVGAAETAAARVQRAAIKAATAAATAAAQAAVQSVIASVMREAKRVQTSRAATPAQPAPRRKSAKRKAAGRKAAVTRKVKKAQRSARRKRRM